MQPVNATNNINTTNVQEAASLSMLKNDLNTQANNVQQLMKSLPTVQDKTLGQNVDMYA